MLLVKEDMFPVEKEICDKYDKHVLLITNKNELVEDVIHMAVHIFLALVNI